MEGDIGQRASWLKTQTELPTATPSGGMSHTSAKPFSDLSSFLQPLRIGIDTLYELSYRLSLTYKKLAASPEHFFPTPITRLPTGLETGRYLAVYVGLSYLRVAFIDLLGDQQRVRRTLEKAWPIEEHLRRDRAPELFTFIGDCIADVVRDSLNNPNEEVPRELTTGISFCFPIRQKCLNEAILMPTGKGFALKTDLNLHQALLDGYERHTWSPGEDEDEQRMPAKRRKLFNLPRLRIAAMTNDTSSTLCSLAYTIHSFPNTRAVMGFIVGAGSNATVPLKIADLHERKVQHIREKDPSAQEALVSTEWTLSSASTPIFELDLRTKWDIELDNHCERPGFQPLELMIGGRYIGELVRLIAFDWFHNVLGIPRSALPVKLVTEHSLSTDFLSLKVASNQSDEGLAVELSQELPQPSMSDWRWTADSSRDLRAITNFVQDRAASLVAAVIVGLLVCAEEIALQPPHNHRDFLTLAASNGNTQTEESTTRWKNGPEELAVAVSGGVMQHFPHYKQKAQRYIDQLLIRAGPQQGGKSIFLRDVNDGGLIGTGILAGTTAGEIGGIIGSTFEA
ncbi:hexokinase family protein [Aspergillus nomiae NRRL 13137]|uniref:Phosphotransferase n=1 Tax=Aspergillus nomiae NRRL (strain ATCC 15546 / NRRL 13137 / CBS 260.88 / M93) TaxID=1509407 RepID=A0A0L1IYG4_ASPN3|nr:hexokinase family protein [Aspergillus nomiae NRRL 13137]KNG84544.1 hexokinase family protein [Aspergillus nomiae NRRL 13137]